ncbi:hypothetical protein ACIGKR_29860 [Rhodococcus qingshengii]|uniref:hypothetical protein n=1 Tax=Rhodococcus qingshengii TaxID=334542 RepID=UPI0037C62C62
MAAHELLFDQWDEPSSESATGFIRRRRGDVFEVPDVHLERLLRIGAIAAVDHTPTSPDGDSGADESELPNGELPGDESNGDEPSEGSSGDSSDIEPTPSDDDSEPEAGVERPKQTAAKAVWVEYAIARGMARDDAEALDKRDLIAALS